MAGPSFYALQDWMLDRDVVLYRGPDNAQASQKARVIFLGTPRERTTAGGDVATISCLLIGKSDLDAQRDDRFVISDAQFEVIFVRPAESGAGVVAECAAVE